MAVTVPYNITWALAHVIQRIGFLIAVLSQILLLHFMVPYFDLKVFPKIDNNPDLYLLERTKFQETFTYKASYDMMLLGLFFLLHTTMARKNFKDYMTNMTHG